MPNCPGLDKELRTHKKDSNGIPEDKKNNHAIDALRHICNWFYAEYAKKIHLTEEIIHTESPEQQQYLAQLNYYNQYIKKKPKDQENSTLYGVTLYRPKLNNIRGF